MKTFLNKIFRTLMVTLFILFSACESEESLEIKTPDPSFKLQEPGITSVYLNFGLPQNNAITIAWNDDKTGSTSYDVEMSLSAEFTNLVNLGTVSSKTFSINVEDLNSAINEAGASSFKDIAVYFRVSTSNAVTNSVLFLVTTYPVNPAEFTSPDANQSFLLSLASSANVAMTVNWTDSFLGANLGDVNYTVQAATAGSDFASPVTLGSTTNVATLSITHADFNAVAIGVGLTPGTASNLDLRIVAKTTNQNGNILTRNSLTRIISVTPYNVIFPNLYFVGDATSSGWNNNNNNTVVFRNQNVPNNYVYTGYFNAGAFKLLQVKGQWQPQWGTNDGSTLAVNLGGGSDPGTFNVLTAGYYTYSFTTVGEGGTFSVTPYNATGSATYSSMGLIGAAVGGWSDTDEVNFVQDVNNPHLWYALGVSFTSGSEFLIRADDQWTNVWRYNGSNQLYGTSLLAGSGANFPFNDPSGLYNVWFNDLDGRYVIIPQ